MRKQMRCTGLCAGCPLSGVCPREHAAPGKEVR